MNAIDLFAGAGGFSTGAKMAGINVVWAANHWQKAVEVHAHNHPLTTHSCQDLQQANWSNVPHHDILLASPCCQGHSRARGKENGDPQHDESRSTAWAVVSCAEYHKPPFIIVENVPEFCKWVLYPAWKLSMEALGYAISPHVIDAADYGVPQNRRRLFIICTRTKAPLILFLENKRQRTAETIIDKESDKWTLIEAEGRSENTLERIKNGRKKHGNRFLIAYYGAEHGGRSLSRPIGTITTKDRYALVENDRMRMLSVNEYRKGMSFPGNYILPKQHSLALKMLGNAVPPLMAEAVLVGLLKTA